MIIMITIMCIQFIEFIWQELISLDIAVIYKLSDFYFLAIFLFCVAYVFTSDDNKRLLLDESKLLGNGESINTNAYKAIVNYIKDDNVRYGILLKGEWGCGKTYFANKIKDSFINKDSVWIISLNGIINKEEINDALFRQAYPNIYSKLSSESNALTYKILDSSLEKVFPFTFTDICNWVIYLLKNMVGIKCKLLIIDDLERAGMNTKEVVGYFSDIVKDDLKVLFISNVDKMENKAEFNNISEKIILEELEILPDFDSFLSDISNKYVLKEDFYGMVIKNVFKDENNNNLRNIEKIFAIWVRILPMIKDGKVMERENQEENRRFLEILFKKFVIYQLRELIDKQNIYTESEKDYNNDSYFNISKNEWKSILRTYSLREEILAILSEKYKLCLSHLDFIKELEKNTKDPMYILNDILYNGNKIESNIENYFKSMCDNMIKGKYKKYNEIFLFTRIYWYLYEKNILTSEYDSNMLCEILTKIYDMLKQDTELQKENIPSSWENYFYSNDDHVNRILKDIYVIFSIDCSDDLKKVLSKKEDFIKYIKDENNALNKHQNEQFLKNSNINSIFEWLGDDINLHDIFKKFLFRRYRYDISNSDIMSCDYDDLENVGLLIDKYKTSDLIERAFNLNTIFYRKIVSEYKDLYKYIKNKKQDAQK